MENYDTIEISNENVIIPIEFEKKSKIKPKRKTIK